MVGNIHRLKGLINVCETGFLNTYVTNISDHIGLEIIFSVQTEWKKKKLTSIIKSVKGLRLSGSSSLLQSSRLYLTRNSARFFSSLDTFNRMSIFSTCSGERNRAARMVMGFGERSLAFCHTRFISSISPSGGNPEEQQGQEGVTRTDV